MIVNYTHDGWSIITQRAHGLLAAQICGHWKKDMQPRRWVETLIATAEHDDIYNELRQPELLENGGPKDFKMVPFERSYCEHLLERALAKGRFVGILTSMHIRFLYCRLPAARSYCAGLAKKEKSWIREANTSIQEVKASYELLEFCDAFSLLICQQLAQPERRTIEISNGPDGTPYQLTVSDQEHFIVTPWPFEESSFVVNYESRTVDQLVFKNSAAFRRKLQSAKIAHHVLTLSRTPE